MKTEIEIVYSLLNTVRNAEHNNDEPTTERLMRNYINIYRLDCMRKYYKDGVIVNDEVFQKIPLELLGNVGIGFKNQIPKTVRFTKDYGFYLEKNGISIPIVTSEQFNLSKRNPFGKKLVQAKTEQNTLSIYPGIKDICLNGESENAILIDSILEELNEQQIQNSESKTKKITVDFFGVLVNPSDQPGYDWENDIYPFPAEKLEELTSQLLRKEFGIMAQAKSDEISNSRNDSINQKTEQELDG
jgi:hypothetical protein